MDDESARSFAQRAGLKASTFRGVLDGHKPTVDTLIAIARAGDVSIDWLALGRGPRSPGSAGSAANGEFVGIPRYDVSLSAGYGAFADRATLLDRIPFTPAFLRGKLGRTNAEGLIVLESSGDSMLPTISDGDLVIVDTTRQEPDDGLFALVLENSLLLKRLHRLLDGLEIVSDNRALYGPITVPRDRLVDIQIVGRIRWLGRVV